MTRTWLPGAAARTAGVVAVAALLTTGCLSEGSCSAAASASASCAAGVEYQGRFYMAWSDRLPIAKGERLGEAVDPPPCDDGNGCGGEPDAKGPPTQIRAMRGADPDQVILGRTEGSDRWAVYGRLHADPDDYFRFADGRWHLRKGS